MSKWHAMTVMELLAEMKAGRLTAEELTAHYLERIRRYAYLNAVAEIDPTALEQAKQLDETGDRSLPLFGVPVLVKDNIDVRDLHTTAGSHALAEHIAREDAPIIANLRRNGAVILGKTNMTEFANWVTQGMPGGYSARGGQVVHPYDRNRDPSGSSTGSAVAVAAGLCAAAIGTDTSFSIVACAGEHGVTGFKAAHGGLPLAGIVPIASTLDMPGPIAHTLEDTLLLYRGMGGMVQPAEHASAMQLRIAVNTANQDRVAPAQRKMYDKLLKKLAAAGAVIGEINQPPEPQQKVIMRCEFRRDLEAYLAASAASVRTLRDIIAHYEADPVRCKYGITYLTESMRSGTDDAEYADAMAERNRLKVAVEKELATWDAVLMTGPTNVMHFTGMPSLTLPLWMDGHLPKGMILYGANEARLIKAARIIEPYCEGASAPKLKKCCDEE